MGGWVGSSRLCGLEDVRIGFRFCIFSLGVEVPRWLRVLVFGRFCGSITSKFRKSGCLFWCQYLCGLGFRVQIEGLIHGYLCKVVKTFQGHKGCGSQILKKQAFGFRMYDHGVLIKP